VGAGTKVIACTILHAPGSSKAVDSDLFMDVPHPHLAN